MRKSGTKKTAPKKTAKPAKRKVSAAATGRVNKGLVKKQPQVKQQAAAAHGMFLYTDDAWSLQYFDQNDLHFKEREVFG